METKETIPTAEQFWKQYLKENWTSEYSSMDVVTILMPKAMHEWGVLFAKHYVKDYENTTLKTIKEYVLSLDRPENEIYQNNNLLIMSCFSKAMELIENAYTEEKIK